MIEIYKKLFELKKLTGKVVKGANNPFFKTKYTDLNSVIDATEPALEELGLLYIDQIEDKTLISSVIDVASGEKVTMTVPLILSKNDMQQLGSAITYARRYSRMTLLGLMSVDDDGAVASGTIFVKPAQIKKITGLILETNADNTKFLKAYGVPSIKDMTYDTAEQAIKTLEMKKAKMGEQNGTN